MTTPPIEVHLPDDAPVDDLLRAVRQYCRQFGYGFDFDGRRIVVIDVHHQPPAPLRPSGNVTPLRPRA